MPQEFDVVCLGGGVAGEAIAVGLQNTPDTPYDPKGVLKKAGCNTAGDAYTALNEYMYLAVGAGGEARQGERPQDRARPRASHATQTRCSLGTHACGARDSGAGSKKSSRRITAAE